MIYVSASKSELKNIFKTIGKESSVQHYQRAQAIKLSSKGYTIPEISEALDVHYNSVYNWVTKYLTEGIDGLLNKPRSGRPRLILDSQIAIIEKLVIEEPRRLKVVLPKIEKEIGVNVSLWTVQRALKNSGFSYKRARKSLKNKRNPEEFEKKKSQ
jgi:transposase